MTPENFVYFLIGRQSGHMDIKDVISLAKHVVKFPKPKEKSKSSSEEIPDLPEILKREFNIYQDYKKSEDS